MSEKISHPQLLALEKQLDEAEAKCEALVEQHAEPDVIQAAIDEYNQCEEKVNEFILIHVDEITDSPQ